MLLVLRQIAELVLEFLLDCVRFPWWWYSGGLGAVGGWCWQRFSETRSRVSLGLWFRHFFTPMYGDYSLAGRAISLVMRFLLVWVKLARLSLAAVWYLILVLGWLLLLPVTLLMLLT